MFGLLGLFGPFGTQELLIILVIVMLLFGASKIPELARSLGKSVQEFKKGQSELDEPQAKAEKTEEKKKEA